MPVDDGIGRLARIPPRRQRRPQLNLCSGPAAGRRL